MNRRLLLQVTAPAVALGVALLGASLASVWSISRLEQDLAGVASANAASLEAAQELQIKLRQLRLHSFLAALDPTPERRALVEQDAREFETSLALARRYTTRADGRELVARIDAEYAAYRAEIARAGEMVARSWSRAEAVAWADAHPVSPLLATCDALLESNREEMGRTVREGREVGGRVRAGVLFLGVAGPVAGLVMGVGIAQGLSRSIARLNVRVRDVQGELDQDVGAVELSAGGGLHQLDAQLVAVLDRVRDVVGRLQQQQREMVRAEQLAAVGQLAASVAHEVRNPLVAIKLLVGSALRGGDGRDLTAEDLRVIHGEVERLERTVQTLLDFARPPALAREPADLAACVSAALDVVAVRLRQQGVTADVRQPDGPVTAAVDRGQFPTVLVNLLLNALDAMPSGGRLAVVVTATSGGASVEVRDTGAGIGDVADRLFTPFHTTKPTGSGLGLSVCRRVMEAHGGGITAADGPGGGAAFRLTLPPTPGN